MRVGILTGGGDAPGLNSVIFGALLRAYKEKNVEVIGIKKGWEIFAKNRDELSLDVVKKYTRALNLGELPDDLHTIGGTILYTSRTNPFKAVHKIANEKDKLQKTRNIGKDLASKFDLIGIDALIAIGGDDTCGVAAAMCKYGDAKIVACPKTVDNDLAGTDYTFGFFSASQLASNILDNITTTAQSHQRIFVVEVMGRDAGWLTLYSGLSAGADIILLPETPFDFEKDIVSVLKARAEAGYKYHILAVSEGAYPCKESLEHDFTVICKEDIDNLPKDVFGNPLLTKLGMADKIAKELNKREDLAKHFKKFDANYEIRSVVLGHTMRAGSPNVFDRVVGLRFGYHAMSYIIDGNFGKLTSLRGTEIVPVDIVEGSKKSVINPKSDLIEIRDVMISVKQRGKERIGWL